MQKHLIGFVGPIGSGTTSARKILEGVEFSGYSYGAGVANYILADKSRGKIERGNLQFWGQHALETEGNINYWDEKILERVAQGDALANESLGITLDSLKYHFQISFWKDFSNRHEYAFRLVCINTEKDLRCDRLITRGRAGDPKNIKEFEVANRRDLRGYGTPARGQDTASCMTNAKFDFMIHNNATPEVFKKRVTSYLKQLGIIP